MLANWLNITCPILCNKNSYKYRLQDQPQLKLCKCSLQLDWSLSRKLLFEFRTDYKSLFSTAWIKRPRSWPPSMDASKIPTKKLGYMFSNVVQNRIVQWHVLLACWREWFEGCYKSFSSYLLSPWCTLRKLIDDMTHSPAQSQPVDFQKSSSKPEPYSAFYTDVRSEYNSKQQFGSTKHNPL